MIEAVFSNSGVWVLISTAICVAVLYRYSKEPVLNALDKRSEHIKHRLDEAEELKVEAQELVASYRRKEKEALKEADEIIAEAQMRAEKNLKKIERVLDGKIDRLEKAAEVRIGLLKREAELQVRAHLTQKAITEAEAILTKDSKNLSRQTDKLIDETIQALKNRLETSEKGVTRGEAA